MYKSLIVFLLLQSSISFSQNFFPLNSNLKYQFFEDYYWTDGQYIRWDEYWRNYCVIDDSIIAGKVFYNFSELTSSDAHPFPEDLYYYYDEAEQKLFTKIPGDDTLRLAVDFNLAAEDTFISYIKGTGLKFFSHGLENINLFGDSILAYEIEHEMSTPPYTNYNFRFAEDIGFCYYEQSEAHTFYSWRSNQYLRSAIVDTVIYNPITLNIVTVYPLENRTVSSFPFYLFGIYTTNINLINNFYVDIIQVRGEDTVTSIRKPFDNHYTIVDLTTQVGDRLLVKAFISDNSIFQNYDVFPDSGYAEILILPDPVGIQDLENTTSFSLQQNYPNPFNPSTNIQYSIPKRSFVSLIIYDAMGNEIAVPVNEEKQAGSYNYVFDGSGLASGVYFYRLQADLKTEIRKMILIK